MINIPKILNHSNIRYHFVPLRSGVLGFVYRSKKGRYHILISEALSPKGKLEVYLHELHHVFKDAPVKPYFVGLDMQREYFEGQADIFARETLVAYGSIVT